MNSPKRFTRLVALAMALLVVTAWAFPQSADAISTRLLLEPLAEASGDRFGISVANAGDVNGDGYDDVIAGAELNDNVGANNGRAYVYFGGPLGDNVADWLVNGEVGGDQFAQSVSGAGDVNGDGYDDIIVGAPFNDAGGIWAGRAYVFYGGVSPDATADLTFTGEVADDRFGISVSGAGDMNGDGFADLVVGATEHDAGGSNIGRAYVFFGGPSADAVADVVMTGEANEDMFGVSVSDAGDVNGDGYGDVIVGASRNDAGGANAGRAYVYLGNPDPDATADVTLTGALGGDLFGDAVSGAGDFNGDGYDDVVVGAPNNDGGVSNGGSADVFYGGLAMDTVADISLYGENSSDVLGASVSDAGDVNNDGFDDIIAGAWGFNGGGVNIGAAYVLFGGAAPDNAYDIVVKGREWNSQYGYSVGGGGDITGDGFADFIVGAYLNDEPPGLDGGKAYIYDSYRYIVSAPNGGETWAVGSTQFITWSGDDPADVWLSLDGGLTFDMLRSQAGGDDDNALPFRVPHSPTRFAMVKIAPSDAMLRGEDQSDSLFTIESSIALLTFTVAARPGGGAELAWASEPAVGPQGIAGYRLYRSSAGASGPGTQIGPSLIAGNSYFDATGAQGMRYRLTAVNGLGEELELGREMLAPSIPLAAWPMPYVGGVLNVSFAAASGLGGGAGQVDVSLYDAAGRLVQTLASGAFAPGFHTTSWDGRYASGRRAPSGIYFLRLRTGGETKRMKVVVAE